MDYTVNKIFQQNLINGDFYMCVAFFEIGIKYDDFIRIFELENCAQYKSDVDT